MSEGRTPTATLTEQRRLEENDINSLHEIISRAQNDPIASTSQREALFTAYGEYFANREDKACYDIVLKILNPATRGSTLYEKFENVLRSEGIVLTFDDDETRSQSTARTAHVVDTATGSLSVSRRSSVDLPARARQRIRGISFDISTDNGYLDSPPPRIAHLMLVAQAYDRRTLLRESLDQLRVSFKERIDARLATTEAAIERHEADAEALSMADAHYQHCLKRKAFKQMFSVYRDQQEMNRRADGMYYGNLAQRTFGFFNDEYRIHQVRAIDDERIVGMTLYKWALAAREQSFSCELDRRRKAKYFGRFVAAFRLIQAKNTEMGRILDDEQSAKEVATKGAIVDLWKQKYGDIQSMMTEADTRYGRRLATAVLDGWRNKSRQLHELDQTAEDAREYFLMRRGLRYIKRTTETCTARRAILGKWVLAQWRKHIEKKKHVRYDEAYKQMRRTLKMNLARRILQCWQERTGKIQETEKMANDFRHNHLMQQVAHPTIEIWYDKSILARTNDRQADAHYDDTLKRKALHAMESKAQYFTRLGDMSDIFRQQKSDDLSRKCLRQVQMRAFELRRREEDADAFRARRDRKLQREFWDRIRTAYARRDGHEPPLDLPPATPSQRRAAELTRLSTTPAYTPFVARLRGEGGTALRETSRILEEVEVPSAEEEPTFL